MLIKLKFYLLAALILANFSFARAQSPYELSSVNDAAIFGAAVVAGGSAFLINSNIPGLSEEEINNLNTDDIFAIDRFATNYYSPELSDLSDIFVYTLVASPALLAFSPEIRNDYMTVGTMYAQTIIFATALPYIAKGIVQRTRPFVYNPNAPMSAKQEPEARRSFFSGHTTVAFASAVFLSKVYSDYYPDSKYSPYVWGGSLLAATTVGALRIFSGKHFPTDVLVGAVVGSAIGWFIPELHKNKTDDNMSFGAGFMGLSFAYKF